MCILYLQSDGHIRTTPYSANITENNLSFFEDKFSLFCIPSLDVPLSYITALNQLLTNLLYTALNT